MKIAKVLLLFAVLTSMQLSTAYVYASKDDIPKPLNYVVIGAFAIQKNAVKFTKHAKNLNFSAQFKMNLNRNLYYVYVLSTDDKDKAIEVARKLRSETEFFDTWVYNGILGYNETSVENTTPKIIGVDINPVTEQKIEEVTTYENTAPPIVNNSSVVTPPVSTALVAKKETPTTVQDVDGGERKKFLFKLYRATDGIPVVGDVDVIDLDKARKLASYKGNVSVNVAAPSNKSGDVSLYCETFGYRKVQMNINYNNPVIEGASVDEEGNLVVPFELVRLRKGDIAVMYNVFFYKDAAIMRPESKYEVNSLLEMLKENPKYKIRIHGHCNGSAAGKIITIGDTKNFFALTGSNEGFGTSKKLSEERAKVIREYLIVNGIADDRMDIKAWGGKRPIHDKNSVRAQENVRVEIEILAE